MHCFANRIITTGAKNLIMTKACVPIDPPPRAPSPADGFGTLAVHAGAPHDPVTGAVIESVRVRDPCS